MIDNLSAPAGRTGDRAGTRGETTRDIEGADFFAVWQQGRSIEELAHLKPNVEQMLDELAWWTHTLKAAREGSAVAA